MIQPIVTVLLLSLTLGVRGRCCRSTTPVDLNDDYMITKSTNRTRSLMLRYQYILCTVSGTCYRRLRSLWSVTSRVIETLSWRIALLKNSVQKFLDVCVLHSGTSRTSVSTTVVRYERKCPPRWCVTNVSFQHGGTRHKRQCPPQWNAS